MEYREEDYLQLSGLQHFIFCRRQWALIHLEQQWKENLLTTEGKLLHKNAHDPGQRTLRGDTLTVRAVRIHSARLGLSGECDVVEFHRSEDGITLSDMEGKWRPYPVEYKHGKPKPDICDEAQLCAQAMCLEEMLCCEIPEAAIFYGEPRRRQTVELSPELRQDVENACEEMHQMFRRGYTPRVKPTKSCSRCSLRDICLPELMQPISVEAYMKREGGLD